MSKVHNISEGIKEYFQFIIKGHTYKFRYPNTEESAGFQNVDAKDMSKFVKFISKFISPESKDAPAFTEVQKKMLIPEWTNFGNMIKAEFTGEAKDKD